MSKWLCAVAVLVWMSVPVVAGEPTDGDSLIAAVWRGDANAVAWHLADPDAVRTHLNRECPPHTRCKPITYAAELSDPAILRMLLEAGADPNGTNSVGDNALIVAIMNRNAAGIDVLLEHGADVNQANWFGISPLIGTVMGGDVPLLERLLAHGGDPNTRVPVADPRSKQSSAGVPLLCVAARRGHVEVVRALLEHGADPDLPDALGRTPADCLKPIGSAEILALLER